MEFSTRVNIPKSPFSISHQDKILLLGSCFTENIGNSLLYYGFKTDINPLGIIYNPISIFKGLKNIILNKEYTEADLLKRNDIYFSFDHHGSFSNSNKEQTLQAINNRMEISAKFADESRFVFITLGSAIIYHHKEENRIVANCHKIPDNQFEKRFLTIEEILASFDEIKDKLKDKTVLFTVSPVRHWRDGAVENQRSKSILHESIHQLILNNKNCFYFPAYEIMMDELRDYRYYTEDMLHPNVTAVKYIWERFCETYFKKETLEINLIIEKGRLMHQHRTKHLNTEEDKNFREQKEKFIETFKSNYPDVKIDF